jgi:hypothetical protein
LRYRSVGLFFLIPALFFILTKKDELENWFFKNFFDVC